MTRNFDDVGECVEAILQRVGPRVVLAMPLGIGKPNPIANELYRRAARDPAIELTILTALSLERPRGGSALERRLLDPLVERIFGSYPDLDYATAARANTLPANVRVIEFYFEPGAYLGAARAQQDYLCANYTHVGREFAARHVNVFAQLVAKRGAGRMIELSLGSNPDITVDLLPLIDTARSAGREVILVGQVHPQMPFMLGAAEVGLERFDFLLEHPRYDFDLYAPPNTALGTAEHAIGLHASALVRDAGTLQIGIGSLGDAIIYGLLLRHQQNPSWRQAASDLGTERCAALIEEIGGREPFAAGLFASSEMLVDRMLDLHRAGILRRRVYGWLPLQRLLASGRIAECFDAGILEALAQSGVGPRLTQTEFLRLKEFGVFREDCRYERGRVARPEGEWIVADLADPEARAALAAQCLGHELRGGRVLHAGFFLGPRGFYAALRAMEDRERRQFDLRGIRYINELYGEDQELKILQRAHGRFFNSTMMMSVLGAAVSDALEDGRVVSGVGGQYEFVAMGHALPGARSILCLRSTRTHRGRTSSNLVWSYGHTTIPRHLRDLVVTEYGIADLRGRTDAESIAALLGVADSRFQDALLACARRSGKLPLGYRIPEEQRQNLPERLERAFAGHRRAGLFSDYPFGTDLTAEEVRLARALQRLAEHTATSAGRMRIAARALLHRVPAAHAPALARMRLATPTTVAERVERRLVSLALEL